MNELAAKEWLTKAWHHFSSAKVLFQENHYTDVIAVDLHYAVEITLKSFLAYENNKILKTHNLLEIIELITSYITFEDNDIILLGIVTNYRIKGSYPTPDRLMPSREEINDVIEFTEKLYIKVCNILNINPEELK